MTPPDLQELDPMDAAIFSVSQPELFDAGALISPEDAELVRAGRRYAHTGSTVMRDEKRAAAICAARLLGWSDREIARRMHCDARVVSLVVRAAEESGKLPAVKDVVSRMVGELALATGQRVREAVNSDRTMDAELAQIISKLWVGLGIAMDKLAAPTAASLHLHQHVHHTAGQVAQEWEAKLAALAGRSTDTASIVFGSNAGDSADRAGSGAGSGAPPPPAPGLAPVLDLPAGSVQVVPAVPKPDPERQGGGGGSRPRRPPHGVMGFRRGTLNQRATMCELPSCYVEQTRRARKPHRCCECGGIIAAGEHYHYVKGIWSGEAHDFKTCAQCSRLRLELRDDVAPYYEEGPAFGELGEHVHESNRRDWVTYWNTNAQKRGGTLLPEPDEES